MGDRRRLLLSVALIAAAALAYQLLLLRLLAIVQWQALAGVVVSLALLGHGASGSLLAVLRARVLVQARAVYVAAAVLFALAAPLCFALAQRVPFNALELVWDAAQWPRLAAVYGLLALPFAFAASCFGIVFMRHARDIPRLYAADLLGAAAGAALLTLLLWVLSPTAMLRAVSLCAVLGATVALPRRGRYRLAGAAVAVAAGVMLMPGAWLAPLPSQYKGEQRLLAVMGAERLAQHSSPYGSVSVVASPRVPLRYAPGLSLQSGVEAPAQLAVFTDGDSMSVITRDDGDAAYLGALGSALPYRLLDTPQVLVPGSGGGEAVRQALALGAATVTALEPNPQLLHLVRHDYAADGGAVYDDARVTAVAADARDWLRRDGPQYDLIQILATDSQAGAASGVLAAGEAYLYTVEAFADALARLRPGGLLAITRWERTPPRDGVRLFATAIAALQAHGVDDPGAQLALIRSWQTVTLLVKNGAFAPAELVALQAFCDELGFDAAYYPGLAAGRSNRYHHVEHDIHFEAAQALLSPRAAEFLRDYKFAVAPATDDRPFFFQFLKPGSVPELLRLRDQGGVALLDTGWLLLAATALQALAYSVLLILLPLLLLPARPRVSQWRTLLYFVALGLGFLFIEIAWLQRLVLLLGQPLFAVSAGLAGFLLFAGVGSACAPRWRRRFGAAAIAVAAGALIAWLLLAELLWSPLLDLSAGWPLAARTLAAMLALAPLAFCMGLPFALGLQRIAADAPALVPWAWAINGCASVLAAVLASWMAMHIGFQSVLLAAAALYAVAATSLR
jgi:hypothetical protein